MAGPSEAIPTIKTFDWQQYKCLYDGLLQEHEKVVKTGWMTPEALQAAEALAETVHDLRVRITMTGSLEEADKFLKEGRSFFPIAQLMSKMVADPGIETFDQYIAQLSLSTHDLMNIAVCQCETRKRRVSSETAHAIRGNLRKVIITLPFEACETEFVLKCAHAAAKRLDVDKGKWRTLALKHREPIIEGIVVTILSASPLPPFISLAPLAPPVMHLCVGIYSEMQEKWYEAVWKIMFACEQRGFRDFAAIFAEHPAEKEPSGDLDKSQAEIAKPISPFGKLKKLLIQNKSNYKFSFYLTTLFRDMLKQCTTAKHEWFKKEIISANDISLKTLVTHQNSTFNPKTRRNEDKFARVRYNALKVLGEVQGNYGISQWIIERACAPRERQEVKELARALLRKRHLQPVAPGDVQGEQELKQALEAVSARQDSLANQEALLAKESADTPEQLMTKIQTLSAELAKLQEMLPATEDLLLQGVSEMGPEQIADRVNKIQDERAYLEDLRAQREELLDDQDYLTKLPAALKKGDWSSLE